MDNKTVGVGVIILLTVLILVALPLILQAAGDIGGMTTIDSINNQTITAPATIGGTIELLGQDVSGTPIVTNATNGTGTGWDGRIGSGNYTITQGLGSDGQIATIFTVLNETIAGQSLNVSYSYQPDGYIRDGAGRSVASLIVLFSVMALAIGVLGKSYIQSVFK